MEHTLESLLTRRLSTETPVSRAMFERIVNRLYANGILMREESDVEGRLYDDALRIEPILHDYFSLAGYRLTHNPRFMYMRLYPPATSAESDEAEGPRRLRHRLSASFAAYLLALRHIYKMALDTGDVNERGEVLVMLADVQQAMSVLMNVDPPASRTQRMEIYRELRIQKIVRLPDQFEAESDDMLLAIRSPILDFVSDTQILAVQHAIAHRANGQDASNSEHAERPAGAAAGGGASAGNGLASRTELLARDT